MIFLIIFVVIGALALGVLEAAESDKDLVAAMALILLAAPFGVKGLIDIERQMEDEE